MPIIRKKLTNFCYFQADSLCFGNIDEKDAREVKNVIARHFIDPSRPLHDGQVPKFKSLKLPTKADAVAIFGPGIAGESVPVKYQEVAYSSSEENNAVELILQSGCDLSLGYEGIGVIDLLAHLAYNSAYNQLRTKEQLGYIVSAYGRKTAGCTWALNIVVQSSSTPPTVLEERVEAWLKVYRQELEEMDPKDMADEAQAIVAQLLEQNTKLAQEVGYAWNEIAGTETFNERMAKPAFDRMERLADELTLTTEDPSATTMNGNMRKSPEDLKKRVLEFFDTHYAADAPERRAMSSRVFSQAFKSEYEASLNSPGVLSTYTDMRYLKEFMPSWPIAPYWRVEETR